LIFILTWNKDKWPESKMQLIMDRFAAGDDVIQRWKCASHRQCSIGDRVFLSRTGKHIPGLIGSGRIVSDPREEPDFEDPTKTAWYVDVHFDFLTQSPTKVVVSHHDLAKTLGVSLRDFTPQKSGMPYKGNNASLEELWSRLIGKSATIYPDEIIDSDRQFIEGAVQQVFVNRYERDPEARRKCIEIFGSSCKACGLNMALVYGPDIARDYIHVHHVVPLHSIKEDYIVDPGKDLVPLCPNCHAMVHQSNPPLPVDELQSKIMARYLNLFR
jgi:5-methylcytosine-specific restriction protein A